MSAQKVDYHTLVTAAGMGLINRIPKYFVITGTLSTSRSNVKMLINAAGGAVLDSVKNSTDFLVTPNENVRQGSKYRDALSRGVTIISEQELCEMIIPSVEDLRS